MALINALRQCNQLIVATDLIAIILQIDSRHENPKSDMQQRNGSLYYRCTRHPAAGPTEVQLDSENHHNQIEQKGTPG